MRKLLLLALLSAVGATPAAAKKQAKPVWQVSRTTDPITGASSCVVAALDRAGGMSFTRAGALYPFVENSSAHGVLVGVSSGGRYRLPTGDIVWRVDDRPFRTLLAADNPANAAASSVSQIDAAMKQLVEQQMKLVAAATATSTVASGEKASAMLAEMLDGTGLIFRASQAATGYGLPTGAAGEVGMMTRGGLRPYPLDASFRAGLAACGIAIQSGP